MTIFKYTIYSNWSNEGQGQRCVCYGLRCRI